MRHGVGKIVGDCLCFVFISSVINRDDTAEMVQLKR